MKTGQIIEEREDSVKMKMRFKRFLSGFMAVATLASVIIQPVAVSASELEPEEIPFEQQYAELKDVQDSLNPDEIVKANDIELSYGQEFDVEVDLSGIEGVDESKIKILFHEAKNETGTDFDHFVLFLNLRIVQLIENDQFLINDNFNETNMRRGKDERY